MEAPVSLMFFCPCVRMQMDTMGPGEGQRWSAAEVFGPQASAHLSLYHHLSVCLSVCLSCEPVSPSPSSLDVLPQLKCSLALSAIFMTVRDGSAAPRCHIQLLQELLPRLALCADLHGRCTPKIQLAAF